MRRAGVVATLLVAAWIAAPGGAAATYPCEPTPVDGFGPFGQGRPPLRAKIGIGHLLVGTVIAADTCKPLRGVQDDRSP